MASTILTCAKDGRLRQQKPDRTVNPTDPIRPRSTKASPFPESCAKILCIFYFYNTDESHEAYLHNYHSVYKARDTLSVRMLQGADDGLMESEQIGAVYG